MLRRILLALVILLAGCSRPVDMSMLEEEVTTTPGVVVALPAPTAAGDAPAPAAGAATGVPAPAATPAPAVTRTYPTRAPVGQAPTPDPARGVSAGQQVDTYVVTWGDTLASIALKYGTTVEALLALNGLTDADHVAAGTRLQVPVTPDVTGPATKLIPDSELVYGPAARDFVVAEFVAPYGGYLPAYSEEAEGAWRSGPEIVQLVADHYSVNPRLLLALLELKSGWVTNPNPPNTVYPMGSYDPWRTGLYKQLAWTADQLNVGYYGWRERGLATAQLADARVLLPDGLNAGTAGLEYFLALGTGLDAWRQLVGQDGFPAVYARFFGDPFAYAFEPLVPAGLSQPPLVVPWASGTWYYTGGPHGGWGDGGAWAALDFVSPQSGYGCSPAPEWVTASAAGLVVRSGDGQVVIDLDGDGFEGTGWTLHYSHLATDGRVAAGTPVNAGDPLGHPSCEGGYSEATHVHFARRYNGEWISAVGPVPFDLSGWIAASLGQSYDGTLARGDQLRTACECKEDATNGISP